MSEKKATAVLWWGIVLMLVGAIVEVTVPTLVLGLGGAGNGNEGVAALANGVAIVTQLAAHILLPLGAALIGASVVLFALRRRLPAADETAAPDDDAERYRA